MPHTTRLHTSAGNNAGAIALGLPLWFTAVCCLYYVFWQWAKVIVGMVLGALAGMFGASPSLDGFAPRWEGLYLTVLIMVVSPLLCALSYCSPAMRGLPGTHQFAVLGAIALIAPLACALWVAW
ncbi:hypothetical protein [Streptomyces zagrosensis]|uniref:Uncharacterized protein n=1 Tax=Streptomyces zagrosensis TaxID=1042984 RepID=A0A7W9Q5X1_9ACTN|nr:hypothetical protein [Streptomyces zagrosensis]MBB5934219.1 hypothetical protein [Streptomyces zagrosensis]